MIVRRKSRFARFIRAPRIGGWRNRLGSEDAKEVARPVLPGTANPFNEFAVNKLRKGFI
jgi:hypothetical protein